MMLSALLCTIVARSTRAERLAIMSTRAGGCKVVSSDLVLHVKSNVMKCSAPYRLKNSDEASRCRKTKISRLVIPCSPVSEGGHGGSACPPLVPALVSVMVQILACTAWLRVQLPHIQRA
eukprot:SAG31_NODE_452_length_15484_cov_20.883198_9_plen_120_part_00